MAIPAQVQAELKFGGDVTVGYGNVGLKDDGYVLGHLRGTYTHAFENGNHLEFQVILNARTWQHESGHIDNNYVDYRLQLDMQQYGKITAATFLPDKNRPIADGDLFNEGSIGVSYGTQSAYRNIFARKPIRINGRQFKALNDMYVAYENRIGRVGILATFDPLRSYGPFGTDDLAEEQPWGELGFSYTIAGGTYAVRSNNLGDYELKLRQKLGAAGWAAQLERQVRDGNWNLYRNQAILQYRPDPRQGGLVRFVSIGYSDTPRGGLGMAGITLGQDRWELMLAADQHGDMAVEGSYTLSDKVDLFAGWDNGFAAGEGYDERLAPPVSAESRGDAFEIALQYRF